MASSQENLPSSGHQDVADAPPRRRRLSAEAVSAMNDEAFRQCLIYEDIDVDDLQALLKDPRVSSSNLLEAIEERMVRGDSRIVNAILRKDQSLKLAAVTAAINNGSLDMVKSYISLPDINPHGYIHIAAMAGKLDIVKWLVANGADTTVKHRTNRRGDLEYRGLSPAQVAAYCGHEKTLDYLIDLDLKIPQEWQRLFYDMFMFEYEAPKPGIFQTLCKQRAGYMTPLVDANLPDEMGKTVLHNAPTFNNKFSNTMLQQLLDCGASAFARDREGKTPWDIISRLERHDIYVVHDELRLKEDHVYAFIQQHWDNTPSIYTWQFSETGIGFAEPLRIGKNTGKNIFPKKDNYWVSIQENNDAYFTAFVALSSIAQGYDMKATDTALQFLSRTFLQHAAADRLLAFRETSYNAFALKRTDTNPKKAKTATSAQVDGAQQTETGMNITSLVIPYFHSKLKTFALSLREDLEEGKQFMNQDSGDYLQLSEPEKAKRAFLVSQSKRIRSLNIHLPLTLDESYYLGMNGEQLRERNRDQVLSHEEKNPEKKRLLMVSQLWLWRMDNIVVSACERKPTRGEVIYGKDRIDEPPRHRELEYDPHTWAMFNFQENELYKGGNMSGLQIAALVFSEVVNHIDGPNYSGLNESIFHVFEKAVANVYDKVKSYMNETSIQKISLEEEVKFIHDITDIRDELAMIKNVITDQEEVWTQFYEDLKDEIPKWDDNNRRIAIRPKQQIPKFKRRIQKIDEDAQRVEQWIHGQLDLKKTHASIRESHNSTVLSTTVIGFTIVTIVFTPLSFMTSLLAVPDDNFGWMNQKKYAGKVFMTVAEIVSLLATLGLVVLCLWWLKRRETLASKASNASQAIKDATEKKGRKPSTRFKDAQSKETNTEEQREVEKPWLSGFRRRTKKAAVDVEQSLPDQ